MSARSSRARKSAIHCVSCGPCSSIGEKGREIARELFGVGEREFLGVAFDEKIERVDHRHVGDQVDRDLELARFFRKHEARDEIAVDVLLPVDEVLFRRDVQRIGKDRRAAVRRRAQPYLVRRQRDRAVVAVTGVVVERDVDAQELPGSGAQVAAASPASSHCGLGICANTRFSPSPH